MLQRTERFRALAWGPHPLTYRLRFLDAGDPPANPPETPPANPPANPPGDPPAPPAIVNPDGTYAEGWLTSSLVPEECRQNAQLATHKSLADTLKNWASLEKLRGGHVVPIPPDGADPAAWDTVYDRLGRPSDPSQYSAIDLKACGLDPKLAAPAEFQAEINKIARDAGLSDRQYVKLFTGYNKLVATTLATVQQTQDADKAAQLQGLGQQWPGAQFAANRALAEAFLTSTVPPADLAAIQALGLLDHPVTLKWVHSLASQRAETEPDLETLIPTDLAAAAQTEIAKLENDIKGPLYDEHHAEHAAAVKRHAELLAVRARSQKGAP